MMKIELTDEQLDELAEILGALNDEGVIDCPSATIKGLKDLLDEDSTFCLMDCRKCWENALKSLEIKEGVK